MTEIVPFVTFTYRFTKVIGDVPYYTCDRPYDLSGQYVPFRDFNNANEVANRLAQINLELRQENTQLRLLVSRLIETAPGIEWALDKAGDYSHSEEFARLVEDCQKWLKAEKAA